MTPGINQNQKQKGRQDLIFLFLFLMVVLLFELRPSPLGSLGQSCFVLGTWKIGSLELFAGFET
jgi:hypothetical protein